MSHKTFDFGNHADSQQECSLRLDVLFTTYDYMLQGLAAYAMTSIHGASIIIWEFIMVKHMHS